MPFKDTTDGREFTLQPGADVTLVASLVFPQETQPNVRLESVIIYMRGAVDRGPRIREFAFGPASSPRVRKPIDLSGEHLQKITPLRGTRPHPQPNRFELGGLAVKPPLPIRLRVTVPAAIDQPGLNHPQVLVLRGVGARFSGLALPRSEPAPDITAAPNTIIYAIAPNLDLLWYSHKGRESAAYDWSAPAGKRVGNGWAVRHIFPGSDGVIYSVDGNGDLKWFRHTGRLKGEYEWADGSGRKIGTGWQFRKVFGGGNGIIYALDTDGNLLWTNHTGYGSGEPTWATDAPKKVGEGWGKSIHVFAADNGVIYEVTPDHDLMWRRHLGNGNGDATWAAPTGRKVGNGWDFRHLFAAGDGVIYGVKENGDLLWYKHDGYADGSTRWDPRSGTRVGNGWNILAIFSGASLRP